LPAALGFSIKRGINTPNSAWFKQLRQQEISITVLAIAH
jgi:hypothetical protein